MVAPSVTLLSKFTETMMHYWVVERSFAWAARFRRLARDYERLPETLAGLHFLAFAMLTLKQFFAVLAKSP